MLAKNAKNSKAKPGNRAPKPGSKPRTAPQGRDGSQGPGPQEPIGIVEPGIQSLDPENRGVDNGPQIDPGFSGAERGTPSGTDANRTDPWAASAPTAPVFDTPSLLAILAPLKSPQTIGELVCILFDTIEKQRGPHWHVDQAAVTAAIGGPIHAWIENLDTKQFRLAEKIAGPTAIGFGLLSVFLPIALGEWALYQERKNGSKPQANTSPDPRPEPAPSNPPGSSENGVPLSEIYGASLGFGPGANAPDAQEAQAGIGLMAG